MAQFHGDRSRDLRELVAKHKQESPADARDTRDSTVIPRWPPDAILDFIKSEIAPFDPPTPKTLDLEKVKKR